MICSLRTALIPLLTLLSVAGWSQKKLNPGTATAGTATTTSATTVTGGASTTAHMATDGKGDDLPVTNSKTQPASNTAASAPDINQIIPLPLKSEDNVTASISDWVLVYNMCATKNQSAIYLQNSRGTVRDKPYLKRGETVRMVVTGNNPMSGTLVINTSGMVTAYDTTNGLMKLTGIKLPALPDSKSAPAPPNAISDSMAYRQVLANQLLIDNYRVALEATRKGPLFQECLSEQTILSYYNAPVPNTRLSRDKLVTNQQQLLANLPNGDAKQKGEKSLTALQTELDNWANLLLYNNRTGALTDVAGKDYIRFEVNQRRPDGSTNPLLAVKDVPVYGNFRVNVSTGFLFNRLVDYSYLAVDEKVWQQNNPSSAPTSSTPASGTGVTRKVPVLDSPGWGTVGVGALAHFYLTLRSVVMPALSIGASLNSTGKYTALFGGSLILGHEQRIILTAGYSFGPVNRLQEPFREGVAYDYAGVTFPTSTRTLGGWSFGLTWNLSAQRTPVAK